MGALSLKESLYPALVILEALAPYMTIDLTGDLFSSSTAHVQLTLSVTATLTKPTQTMFITAYNDTAPNIAYSRYIPCTKESLDWSSADLSRSELKHVPFA